MISVIIPTKDRVFELISALTSLLDKDIGEVILVDSSKNIMSASIRLMTIKKMLELHGIVVKHLFEVSSITLAEARLAGGKLANGEYILTMDDDAVLVNKVGQLAIELEKSKDTPSIVLGCQDVNDIGDHDDWSDEIYSEKDFYKHRKNLKEKFSAKWESGIFHRYNKPFKKRIPYGAGTCLYRKKDFMKASEKTIKQYKDRNYGFEDVYTSMLVTKEYADFPLFYSDYYIYHLKNIDQKRTFEADDLILYPLVEEILKRFKRKKNEK